MSATQILVIDDEPVLARTIARILRTHVVKAITDAREALADLASGERYDIIISDMVMPNMSGIAFYRQLEAEFPSEVGKVVFMSGGPDRIAEQFLAETRTECVDKPVSAPDLRALVERRLRTR